jgi:hypothetical protein
MKLPVSRRTAAEDANLTVLFVYIGAGVARCGRLSPMNARKSSREKVEQQIRAATAAREGEG